MGPPIMGERGHFPRKEVSEMDKTELRRAYRKQGKYVGILCETVACFDEVLQTCQGARAEVLEKLAGLRELDRQLEIPLGI